MARELPELQSISQFLFEVPLYEEILVSPKLFNGFYSITNENPPIDGYCPSCHRESTFSVKRIHLSYKQHREDITTRHAPNEELTIVCARSNTHVLRYFFRKTKNTVQKIGQFPSFADIANDEVSQYRKLMKGTDANEFHKAIGLAAHGAGVGSFVYLRRVFERLIYKRFEEFKTAEGWKDADFYNVRMEEKIGLLKAHLPDFLIENRKVYSILSTGVHELDEKTCLQWFEVMKQSIVIMLEDDKKKKEELSRRSAFAQAIKDFGTAENKDKA